MCLLLSVSLFAFIVKVPFKTLNRWSELQGLFYYFWWMLTNWLQVVSVLCGFSMSLRKKRASVHGCCVHCWSVCYWCSIIRFALTAKREPAPAEPQTGRHTPPSFKCDKKQSCGRALIKMWGYIPSYLNVTESCGDVLDTLQYPSMWLLWKRGPSIIEILLK